MKVVFIRELIVLAFVTVLTSTGVAADEWGDWDDLPDQLLSPSSADIDVVDAIYDQLSRSEETNDDAVNALDEWLDDLDLEFSQNEELSELLESLKDEPKELIESVIDDWLNEQLEDLYDETEEELDFFDEEFVEDDEFDDEDDFDDEDEFDEFDEEDEDEEEDL